MEIPDLEKTSFLYCDVAKDFPWSPSIINPLNYK